MGQGLGGCADRLPGGEVSPAAGAGRPGAWGMAHGKRQGAFSKTFHPLSLGRKDKTKKNYVPICFLLSLPVI